MTVFFPIRAPVTIDDFQSDGYKTNSSESNISGSSSVDNEFVSSFQTILGDRDEESLVLAKEEKESSVTDEFVSVIELDNVNSNGARLIAQLSMDNDEFYEVAGDEGVMSGVEDGRLSDVVNVPSFGVQEREDTML
uniref:Uncharacterized protein n=1 Tax=Populus alba TaxID=43335 RepID=A0A4U5PLU8_POPAL|nr:hypothetical protein D5086_0000206400 [Populus alba]